MSLKTYNKNLQRMYKTNLLRLFAIGLIVAIGIAIATSVGAVADQIADSINNSPALNEMEISILTGIADKVQIIGGIIPPLFIAISVLVTATTFARLIEEERSTIACYKTLGYSNFLIISRYVVFSFTSAVMGCLIGVLLGNFILRPTIFDATVSIYDNLIPSNNIYLTQGLSWSAATVVIIVLTALFVSFTLARKKPSTLLRHKSPKAGKVILLERFTFFWKMLSFKFKSTFRNIFRFKSRLVMTLVSVASSTIMLWVGIGLFATINGLEDGSIFNTTGFTDSMTAIAAVVTVCGILLAILVLFNLTNINIAERQREIATLKVLGYKPAEVAGFIYREVIILSTLGMLIGLPSGYYFNGFLFNYLNFGSLGDIFWYHWLIVALVIFAAVVLSCFLLYRKIYNIQMVSSLKTVE